MKVILLSIGILLILAVILIARGSHMTLPEPTVAIEEKRPPPRLKIEIRDSIYIYGPSGDLVHVMDTKDSITGVGAGVRIRITPIK